MKSGSLNLLEPSGLVQACNGNAFTFNLDGSIDLILKLTVIRIWGWKTKESWLVSRQEQVMRGVRQDVE
jgi:hypothetical protein